MRDLNPANDNRNQCDGCHAGYPIRENGFHYLESGYPYMACLHKKPEIEPQT